VVVDAACAAIFQQTTSETNFSSILRYMPATQNPSNHSTSGGGLVGVGVPNKNRFRLCGASFNPARAFLHVLFYWKGDLVSRFRREQIHQHVGAETPNVGAAF